MTTNHTHGPWTVWSRIDRYAAAGEKLPHGTASYIIKAAKDRTIARITHAPGIADVQAADARLIAAAPDLLAALQALVEDYEPNLKAFALNAPRKAKWESAVAAIARATGGAA